MMLNRLATGFAVASTAVNFAVATPTPDPTSDYMGVFKTSAFMALEWQLDGVFEGPYSTEDIFAIEDATNTYFSQLLADKSLSAFQFPNKFVDLEVAVREQILTGENMVMDTTLTVFHIGNSGIADLTDLLRFVTNKNTTGSENFIALDSLIGMGVNVGMVSFSNSKESVALAGGFESYYLGDGADADSKYSEGEKALIVVVSVLSFALFALSIILIWVAGGWLALRRQVDLLIQREEELTRMTQCIEQKPTEDTEEENNSPRNDGNSEFTNPSGILGVNPYYGKSTKTFEGLGVKMTPARSRRSDSGGSETPMSEYSDSDRMPIGITSMRKLLANRNDQDLGDDAEYGIKALQFDE